MSGSHLLRMTLLMSHDFIQFMYELLEDKEIVPNAFIITGLMMALWDRNIYINVYFTAHFCSRSNLRTDFDYLRVLRFGAPADSCLSSSSFLHLSHYQTFLVT